MSPQSYHTPSTFSSVSKGEELDGDPKTDDTLGDYKVWNPPANESVNSPQALPDSYFEPTKAELKASYQAQVRVREALVNAPLKTKEMREREAKAKLLKWPTTTIRVKFPDRTQLERSFSSTEKIKSVYAFVRNALREDVKPNKFILYQTPPRRELKVSDPKVRDFSLLELQLAPSSVLHLSFLENALNNVILRAPLSDSILSHAQNLPPPPKFDDPPLVEDDGGVLRNKLSQPAKDNASKSVPKWFKIGQKK